jgi:hypothetical protein
VGEYTQFSMISGLRLRGGRVYNGLDADVLIPSIT